MRELEKLVWLVKAIEKVEEVTVYVLTKNKDYFNGVKVSAYTIRFYLNRMTASGSLKREHVQTEDNRTKIVYKKTQRFAQFKDKLLSIHTHLYGSLKETGKKNDGKHKTNTRKAD